MLSKKYIFVLAVAVLMFSCQKETIRPNHKSGTCLSDDGETSALKVTNRDKNKDDNTSSKSIITVDPIELHESNSEFEFMRTGTEITDPNNDDDRNKKKKN